MQLITIPTGVLEENTYIVIEDQHAFLVDPGSESQKILATIPSDVNVDFIILTHGHNDHTQAVDDIVDQYHCPVYIHPLDYDLIDPKHPLPYRYVAPVYSQIQWINPGQITIGHFLLQIYHTPGHTAGGICIQYKDCLFTGDTLFANDCGRTDLHLGSEEQLQTSLQFLKTLPHHLRVLSGHGPASTIGQEIKTNPYL